MDATELDDKSKVLLRPVGAIVPFANPLADEKTCKKVLRSVKKGAVPHPFRLLSILASKY